MLKVLGVTAPHYVKKQKNAESTSLNSSDPFSLYNAYKVCAHKAENGDEIGEIAIGILGKVVTIL